MLTSTLFQSSGRWLSREWQAISTLLLVWLPVLLASPVQGSPLDAILNPNGTIRAGAHGSFSTVGYRLETGKGGIPMFRAGVDEAIARLGPTATLANGVDGMVRALAVDGSGNVYAGGRFTTAGGVAANNIAKWNGNSWSALGTGLNSDVDALAVDGSGNVYAGGSFTTAGGVAAKYIAKWNGSSWSALGTSLDDIVLALAVDNSGNVYAGGFFTTAGGIAANNIAKWNGRSWSALGTGLGTNSYIHALAVDNSGNVYAGGGFTTAGGIAARNIAKWNGRSWSALGTGTDVDVLALAIDGSGNIYVGSNSNSAGGVTAKYIAKWNGSSWSALGTGISREGIALAVDGSGSLYVGGIFSTAGGVAVNSIAKWNGSNWSALGTGLDRYVQALAVDGSGNVYAGGDFATAGGVTANGIAKWNGTTWSPLETLIPMLATVTPSASAIGTTITLTGSNLSQATAVTFTGSTFNVVTTGFTVTSAGTQITNITVPSGAITGTIKVTTPGGVSNSIPFTVLPPALTAYHLQQLGVATSRVDLHYQATEVVKVCADAAAGTLFSVTRSGNQNLKLRIQENPTSDKTSPLADATGFIDPQTQATTATAVEAVYYHPAFVDVTGPQTYKNLHLELVDNASGIVVGTYPIQVVRPPLLLVHGLWSDGPNAFPGLPAKLVNDGVYGQLEDIRYAHYDNDREFSHNAKYIINDKSALLQSYADRNISASKIDVIGHSMGGLLIRQYIQSSAYQQDINKLITLNTPHSGSPIANWLTSLSQSTLSMSVGKLLTYAAGNNPFNGAVADLAWNRPTNGLAQLNASPNTHGVAVHAVTTTTTLPGSTTSPATQLLNEGFGYAGVLLGYMTLTRTITNFNQFLADSVFQCPGNDFIVGLDSQQGGLASSYTDTITGQWHGSGGNPAVQTRLVALLRANSHSTATTSPNPFTTAGFQPVPIHSIYQRLSAPPTVTSPVSRTTSTLLITSPVRNQVVADLDSIQVAISASSDVTRIMLICGTGTAELTTKLITGAGGTVYIKVPKRGLGRLKLAALAFAGSAYVQYDTLGTRLTTKATLTGLRLEPRYVYTSKGDSAIVQVTGAYSDGIDRNILSQPGLLFSFPGGGKARMGGHNSYVVGLAPGRDSLRVTYAGRADMVPLMIGPALPTALATQAPVAQELAVWPNPAQQIVQVSGIAASPIDLLDLLGRAVRHHAPVGPNQVATLDLHGLAPGLYLLRVGSVIRRLLVE